MLRVVIDTNAIIDANSDEYNYANRILDLVISGQVEAYANHRTLRENKFLVERKITDEGFRKKLEYFFDVVNPMESSKHLTVVEDDPEDDKILESAFACQADYLITSDKHLLVLEKYKGTKILRPREFWSIYEDEGSGWANWLKNFIH